MTHQLLFSRTTVIALYPIHILSLCVKNSTVYRRHETAKSKSDQNQLQLHVDDICTRTSEQNKYERTLCNKKRQEATGKKLAALLSQHFLFAHIFFIESDKTYFRNGTARRIRKIPARLLSQISSLLPLQTWIQIWLEKPSGWIKPSKSETLITCALILIFLVLSEAFLEIDLSELFSSFTTKLIRGYDSRTARRSLEISWKKSMSEIFSKN